MVKQPKLKINYIKVLKESFCYVVLHIINIYPHFKNYYE